MVHVDIMQAIFLCLLRADIVDLSPGQELLIACGVWMHFSLSFIFNLGKFSEVDGNYMLGLPNK